MTTTRRRGSTRKKRFVEVKVNGPSRRRSNSKRRVSAPVAFGLLGVALLAAIAVGGPLSLLWAAGASGAAAGGAAAYNHRQRNRRWREAGRKQREAVEAAKRRQRIRDHRKRQQQTPPPSSGQPVPDGRITTPSGCTPQCFGASKPDPEGKCGCPCGGSHHGEGHRLRAQRRREKAKRS